MRTIRFTELEDKTKENGARQLARLINGLKELSAAEQERLDLENIRLEKLETEESIRRTEESHAEILGSQRTQVGSSGFATGSSLDKYVSSTQEKHASDIDWMRTSGASRAAIGEREAAARKNASEAGSKARTISNIGGAIGSAAGAGAAANKYGWGWS